MIFSRLLSLILRAAQFVFAVVVLGLTAYFLSQRARHGVGPFGRIVFTVIWSSLSILLSIIWMIPTKSTMASYGSDLGTPSPLPPLFLEYSANKTQSSPPAGPPPSHY
jgi:hypothetical protein